MNSHDARFRDACTVWSARIERARHDHFVGDLLVLAEEAPSPALRVMAFAAAGDVLLEDGNNDFALEQFLKALAIDPSNLHARRKKAMCLQGAHQTAGEARITPRRVFLFSGHLADTADRSVPRFPRKLHAAAAHRIAHILDATGADADDLALTQGACGGDLIFLEACAARELKLKLMLPLDEPAFIEQSVISAADGEDWRLRYLRIRNGLTEPPRILPAELGTPVISSGEGEPNPFERCNRWLLNTALAFGADRLQFICLWDGKGGDGPGGTAHMVQEVRRRSGKVHWIDTHSLEPETP